MADFDPDRTYRAVVIGSGSGGLTAAIGLAGFGHDVVVVEAGDVGGDCTNVGCIPSKALLHAAAAGTVDPLDWTRSRRDRLRAEEDAELEHHDRIALVRGRARLTNRREPHVVVVERSDGSTVEVTADHVVVSTGSSPARPAIDGLAHDRVVTTDELFELTAPPDHLLIVGGGPIALEMATAFTDLGSRVSIVEVADRLLPREDPIVSSTVRAALEARGVDVHTSTSVVGFDGDRRVARLDPGGEIDEIDLVLLAAGRRPNVDRLGLDDAGVTHDERGIAVDDWGRTGVDGIWAVGDVTGRTLTTHGANAIGRRVVRAIALPRLPLTGAPRTRPSVAYSRPEVASVGRSVDELAALRASGRRRYVVDLASIDRGFTDEIDHGVVVVDAERFTGRVLRASIVGPAAAEWIGIFTLAIDRRVGLRKLFGMVHPYPSHAEAIGRIADGFARDTYPAPVREWWAMLRGRIADRRFRG